MNLLDLLQMTKGQPVQQAENSISPIMQFLAQHRSQPMPLLQMPNMPDHSGMILQAGLQKQEQQDQYAAHLQAKAQMEAQQAAAVAGHEAELSDDPQVQAMLRSGNPQLVAYAMKIAEDEKQKKIAAQYNENPTYQKWLNSSSEERALMEQYLRTKTPSTNVYTDNVKPPVGYRWGDEAHTAVVPLTGGPADVAAQPLTESQAKAMSNLKVMEETSKQYDEFLARTKFDPTKISAKDSFAQGLISIDSPLAEAFGLTPSVEAAGRRMASPESLEYFTIISRWNEIFGREKSGGAIKNPEYRAWLMQYWPGPNDSPEVVAQKTAARKAYEQSQMDVSHPEFRQQATNTYIAKVVDAGKGYNVVETADGTLLKQEGDRATRNNNPGNLEYRGQNGAIGSDGRFAIFQSKEAGSQAMANLLFNSDLYGNLRLSEAIHKYAPPVENNTSGYLSRVLAAVGNKNKLMSQYSPEERAAIIRAMQAVEGNKPVKMTVLQQHKEATKMASSFTKNSPANKDKKAELEKRAAALGW